MPAVSKAQQKFFGIVRAIQKGEMAPTTPETAKAAATMKKKDVKDFASTKHKKLPEKVVAKEESNPRIPRKKGQPANSKKHSDLYTDENPKGTIHGLGFKDVATAKASVSKIRKSSRSHAHKIQAAVAMEQRAREMGKSSEAAVYRKFINSMKKKTKKMNETFTIDPKAHRQQQRAKKIRDRTKTGDEGSEIAKKKVKGPALFGEGKWSDKYKKSIDCNNPKGFSQRAHCQGKKKVSEESKYDRYDKEKKQFAKADRKMKFGKFYDKAKEARDRLRPGEVKKWDPVKKKYVSNKD